MPFLKYTTSLRVPRLRITITHTLHAPDDYSSQESEPEPYRSRTYKIHRPKDIDIFPHTPQLNFVVCGKVDGVAATANQVCASGIGRHLLECMRRNATLLGIHNISELYLENGIPNISFTSSHPLSDAPASPRLTFVSVKIVYAWITTPQCQSEHGPDIQVSMNPITSPMIVPFADLLDQIVHRLISHHILRNYPLIFGPYSHSIRGEQALFPSVAKSLCSIIRRSQDRQLKQHALICIQKLRTQNALRSRSSRRAVQNIISPSPANDSGSEEWEEDDDDETTGNALEAFSEILGTGLTIVYQKYIKPWNKGLHINTHDDIDDEIKEGTNSLSPLDVITGTQAHAQLTLRGSSAEEIILPIWDEERELENEEESDDILDLDEHYDTWKDDDDRLLPGDQDEYTSEPQLGIFSSFTDPERSMDSTWKEADVSLDLDSDPELTDALTELSRDFWSLSSSLPSLKHNLLHGNLATNVDILADSAQEFEIPAHGHQLSLPAAYDLQENDHNYMRDNKLASPADLTLDSADVGSDMDVLEFDLTMDEVEEGGDFEIPRTPDLSSQGSSQCSYASPLRDGQVLYKFESMTSHVDINFDFDESDGEAFPSIIPLQDAQHLQPLSIACAPVTGPTKFAL